ncbi:IPTL-CTERM sorting domain-containing protein [Zoogloea sp.]|uniref:beta strand repeat-containing protein n=1 Tax=Zoogloea sp. TaxID=49181 RepID=UPI0031FBB8B9
MINTFRFLFLIVILLAGGQVLAQCVSLTTTGAAYTQNFDTLSNTAGSTTNNLTIPGWFMTESGGGARDNEQYAVDTGASTTGDTYSYGAAGSTERALGLFRTGTLIPLVGACFTNNTGATVSSLDISYTGEEWRLGTAGRTDQINFEYSTSATDLSTGVWTAVSALNFVTPDVVTVGAKNGNTASDRTALSSTISSLSIANGATFWIRWTDSDATGADDGLAVDDFALTPNSAPVPPNLSINDVSLLEGHSGTTTFTFTVSLSTPAGAGGVTFDIATADGAAVSSSGDYTARSLTSQTIPAGSSTYTFSVSVAGDTAVEVNETFFVNVTNVTGAVVTDGQGQGTIVNDDIEADLSITKTDGVTTVMPGASVTYTIIASNAGPGNAPGTVVADTFPATFTGSWTCVGAGGGSCTASGSGSISDTVNLPAGASVTYTVSGTVGAGATGTLSNTATVAAGVGVTDPIPGNNSATDTDTLVQQADLSITKTDGVATASPGGSVTYTITASNAGPGNAPGSTVADTFPAILTGSWTCVGAGGGTCTAAGSGSIHDTVNLPAGGSVTYTVSATIGAGATGTLSNTATVSVSGGVTDPNPANNSATDTDTLSPRADLSITKTDGVTTAAPGGSVTYTITASNAGPSNAPGSTVVDTFPAILTGTWTCVGAGGGTCTAAGSGSINDTVNLPAGGSVTYTVSATISAGATGTLSNTATVSAAGGVTDPNPGNNAATDSDALVARTALLSNIPTRQGGVTASLAVSGCSTISRAAFVDAPAGAAVGTQFPFGLVDFSLGSCAGAVSVTVTYSQNLPAGAVFYKEVGGSYSTYPATLGANSVSFSLTDNGPGDSNPAAGVIDDPSGIGVAPARVPAAVPTLSEWGALALSALVALLAFGARSRRR